MSTEDPELCIRRIRVGHLLVRGDTDGIGLHVLDLTRAQCAAGAVDPMVLTCPSSSYADALASAGVPVIEGGAVRIGPALARYLRCVPGSMGVDLVHLHGYRATHLLPALRILRPGVWGLPVVATCHLLARGTLRKIVRSEVELRCYRLLDLLITSSAEQAARARSMHPGLPVRYIPNGVCVPEPGLPEAAARSLRERFGFPAAVDVVATIGRLHPQKRLDLFLEACRLISRERPETCFLVIGEGSLRAGLEALAREKGLASSLRFTGFVDDVPQICEGLTLLIHTADNEGTPRAVLHAMASGCPVVATASGGVPDMISDGLEGLVVPRGDFDGLAQSALWMLAHPFERLEMGRRARKRVESDFSIDVMRRRVEEAYRQALDTPNRSRGRR